jgi:hypothetical protein
MTTLSFVWAALVDPPVDWRGIAYVLGGVIVTLASAFGIVVRKLYNDLKACRAELAALASEQERFLKGLLEDL